MEVYIVHNDYMPDAGTWVFGVYDSLEKAEEALKQIKTLEAEGFKFTEEEADNFDIQHHNVY